MPNGDRRPVTDLAPGRLPEPVPLRPLAPAELLDQAFAVLKAAPATLLGLAAVFVVPVQVLNGWLQRDVLAAGGMLDVFRGDPAAVEAFEEGDGGLLSTVVVWLGGSFTLTFVAAGVAVYVAARHAGREPGLGELFRTILRRSPALLVAWFCVRVLQGLAFFACFVPAVFVMALFLVTAPVIGVEATGPFTGMRRAAQLARRRYWPTLGVGLLSGFVATLFDQALAAVPDLLALLLGTGGANWGLLAVSGVMSSIITTPVVAAATTLHYLDLRVRSEGLDLELQARTAFPDA